MQEVNLVYVDQGYTGDAPEAVAAEHGIELEVAKHTEAKKGFVLLPRRWVVERSFVWISRFRRLGRNYERLQRTFAALHSAVSAALMLSRCVALPRNA